MPKRDPWMKQLIAKNYSSDEQRTNAMSLFVKIEIIAYILIFIGFAIFLKLVLF